MSALLVTPAWLNARLGDATARVIDASWYLPTQGRDAHAEFRAGHIPGAVFFDIDAISDRSATLPHMLPDESAFAEAAGTLGLAETDEIIVYDGSGLFSAPRAWWTLRVFGAQDVRVLDGGLPAWTAAGLPLASGDATPEPARFNARLDRAAIRSMAEVAATLAAGTASVIDARSAARFNGTAPEPRPGLRSGHMPGALNLPYDALVEAGRLRPPAAIRSAFRDARVDLDRPVVTTCGSGVTAALLTFALAVAGKTDVSLYDGSWSEWAAHPENPIATGPA